MIPVAQIKKEFSYSQNLADIIDVLKLISSTEFSSLSARVPREDILKKHILSCFELLTGVSKDNPFFVEKKGAPPGFLMICSDEGFLGKVNTNIVTAALSRGLARKARFMVLGDKGARILRDTGVDFIPFPRIKNNIKMEDAISIANFIMDLYRKGEMGTLYVIYMQFKSFTSHKIEIAKLLPCDELIGFIRVEEKKGTLKTLVEPNPYYVLDYLVKLWLQNNLFYIFWSSKLSEWSVRTMHLEHSSDELKEINKGLRFKYFKAVHALNDKVIREIFAARAAA